MESKMENASLDLCHLEDYKDVYYGLLGFDIDRTANFDSIFYYMRKVFPLRDSPLIVVNYSGDKPLPSDIEGLDFEWADLLASVAKNSIPKVDNGLNVSRTVSFVHARGRRTPRIQFERNHPNSLRRQIKPSLFYLMALKWIIKKTPFNEWSVWLSRLSHFDLEYYHEAAEIISKLLAQTNRIQDHAS